MGRCFNTDDPRVRKASSWRRMVARAIYQSLSLGMDRSPSRGLAASLGIGKARPALAIAGLSKSRSRV